MSFIWNLIWINSEDKNQENHCYISIWCKQLNSTFSCQSQYAWHWLFRNVGYNWRAFVNCQLTVWKEIFMEIFPQFIRWKMSKEDTIPISLELAKVIQEQQQYIQDNLGEYFTHFVQENLMVSGKDRKKRKIYSKPDVMIAVCFINAKRISWRVHHRQFRKTLKSNSSISPYGRNSNG